MKTIKQQMSQGTTAPKETPEQELARLKQENELLKQSLARKSTLSLKVSQKGAVSLYGMGRFPVTLYKEQWLKLIAFCESIKSFINENEHLLADKEVKKAQAQAEKAQASA